MPDIASALRKALSEWDTEPTTNTEPVQATTPKEITMPAPVATNASRSAFEFIRDNPGVNMDAVVSALTERGFKPHTVSSLVYQMLKVRLVVADANGKFTAVVREYVPIQTSIRRKAKAKAKAKPVVAAAPTPRKHIEIVNTLTGEVFNPRPTPVAAAPQMSMTLDAETLLNNLSIVQARALYDELRKIFGVCYE